MFKKTCLLIAPLLAACGGGNDPAAYKATEAGPGSTVSSAEVAASGATIRYAQYNSIVSMVDPKWSSNAIDATVSFDTSSKRGTIQFALLGGTETVSTTDGYGKVTWAGPLTYGAYGFQGNILLACNPAASPAHTATHVFVSSSMTRVKEAAPLDELFGRTFDVVDCAYLQKGTRETLSISASGVMSLSGTPETTPPDQMINMLNPEKWGGGWLGRYVAGHAFRYGSNGVTKHAIVLQTRTFNTTTGKSEYHYALASER